MKEKETSKNPYIIQSVQKTLRVLKVFNMNNLELSLKEISDKLGYNKSNVLRIIETLKEEGFIIEHKKTKKYRLGITLFHLGNYVFESMNIRKIAIFHMERASNILGLVTHLGVMENDRLVVIEKIWPEKNSVSMRMVSQIGETVPFHCTGVGKVILAFQDDEARERILSINPLNKYTKNTITNKDNLYKQLEIIKTRGYAINDQEHEPFIKCITYPIYNHKNKVTFALSFTGLSEAMNNMDEDNIHKIAKETVDNISNELGNINND